MSQWMRLAGKVLKDAHGKAPMQAKAMDWARAGIGFALLALAGATSAQTIYKYMGADGVIEYSTTKPQGRPIISEIEAQKLSPEEKAEIEKRRQAAGARGAGADPGAKERLRRLDDANANVARAEQKLKEAQDALANGQEPLAGERSGTASGRSRLNDAYDQRMQSLQQAVDDARKELDEAYRARNAP